MVKVIDSFGVSKEEFEAVESEANRLAAMGYKVPAEVEIKFMNGRDGLAGSMKRMYVHPIMDIEYLKFVVRHEIGHHNEPEVEFDIWSSEVGGYLTNDKIHQASEDFANDFARRTK